VRLATFNLLNGRSLTDGQVDLTRLQEAVAALDADVLALQEVDRDQPRSHGADLTALAASAMGATAHRFVPTMSGLPGTWAASSGSEDGPLYGIALLSRWPVRRWEVVLLDAVPVVVPLVVSPRRVALVRDEPRAALVAVVDGPLGEVAVVSTHLSFVPGWGTRQLRRVARHVTAASGPVALLGDLNAGPRAVARASRLTPLVAAPTFPAPRPVRQLDHVLVRGLTGRSGRAVELPLSDHRALVVDVALDQRVMPRQTGGTT
jgi:endonuclease/exonuclease/phosphatase family metal-dependent hydrolase